jgi:hypothetical protein
VTIPIASNLFKDKDAMPVKVGINPGTRPSATQMDELSPKMESRSHAIPYNMPVHMSYGPAFYPLLVPMGMPAYSSLPYYGHPNMHIPPPPVRSHGTLSMGQQMIPVEEADGYTPASSSPPPSCELDQYCHQCSHDAEIQNKLEELGFVPGDNLASTPSKAYEKAGFKYFEWQHVLKADKKFCQAAKQH